MRRAPVVRRLVLVFRVAAIFTMLLVSTAVVLPVPPANAYPCTNLNPRAGTQLTTQTARGVSGYIRTPESTTVGGTGAQKPSAADVVIHNSAVNLANFAFVQFGWYLGSAGTLPVTTTPRVFWGENAPGGEQLHAGYNLSWDTVYKFTITPSGTPGVWDFALGGNYLYQNNYAHTLDTAQFNGEVAYLCTRMDAAATRANSPQRSLQYLSTSGTWGWFTGSRYSTHSAFYSVLGLDIATNYAFGGGP